MSIFYLVHDLPICYPVFRRECMRRGACPGAHNWEAGNMAGTTEYKNKWQFDDEIEDERYCEKLYQDYLDDPDPDKNETISLEELAEQEGITL